MPFHLHIPLPGPFSYSTRIGGRRRGNSNGGVLFWLFIGWWLVPPWLIMKWTIMGPIVLGKWIFNRRSQGGSTRR